MSDHSNKARKCALLLQAKNNETFKKWDAQNQDKFGFIHLGDLNLPNVNLTNSTLHDPLSIHLRLKNSHVSNFLGYQINVKSQLNIEKWDGFFKVYWDRQIVFLIRYGFPLDCDRKFQPNLHYKGNNHHSAIQFPQEAYLDEESEFQAILGAYHSPPIESLHILPFMTREKQGSAKR